MNIRHQNQWKNSLLTLGTIFAFLIHCDISLAIPHFAREYKTSCMTCHAGYPKLNRVGREFKANGYRFQEDNVDGLVKKIEPVSLGAPATKAVWPSVTWPGEIASIPPLTIRIESRYLAGTDSTDAATGSDDGDSFALPNNVYFLAGGELGETFSYFAHFHLVNAGESGVGTARAWLSAGLLRDTLGYGALNIKVGQVEPAAVPFSQFTSLSLTPYAFNTFSPNSDADHSSRLGGGGGGHHGSGPALGSPVPAIEINGRVIDGRLEYGVGIADRDAVGADSSDFDKNIYGRLAYHLKKQNIRQGELSLWDQTSFQVGAFVKTGRESAMEEEAGHGDDGTDEMDMDGDEGHDEEMEEDGDEDGHGEEHFSGMIEDYTILGADMSLTVKNFDLFGGVMNFSVEDSAGASVDELLFFAEAQYRMYPWLIPYIRWESLNTQIAGQGDVDRVIPGIAVYARANVRCVLEGQLYSGDSDANQLMASLDFVF